MIRPALLLVPAFLPAILSACSGDPDTEVAGVTWHQDVAPIVVERCSGCHQDGGIAGFSLATYEDAKPYAEVMLVALETGAMPPFLAQETEECTPPLPWGHDLRLSDDEIGLIRQWADGGAPEGDPATAARFDPPQPAVLDGANLVLGLPEPIEVSGTTDIHTCLLVDPGLDADTWVRGRLITSGNPAVLHHVVSYLVLPSYTLEGTLQTKAELEAAVRAEKGIGIGERYPCFGGPSIETVATEMLDAWAPGGLPNYAPPDSAQPMPKDSLVLLDIHYHPSVAPEVDADTTLSLLVSDERPDNISQIVLLGNFDQTYDSEFGVGAPVLQPDETASQFLIPAGATGHVEEMTWTWKLAPGFALSVYGAGTHMHYVGRDMRITLEHADGSPDECLIETPAWNFNWQRGYYYDAPFEALPVMENGDVVRMRCVYDNSTANPFVQEALQERGLDAPIDVRLGEDTLDEMCLGAVAIVYPNYAP